MDEQQTAALLAVATTYWPNINRNTNTKAMASAWAKSLKYIPYKAAECAIVELSRECDFPPSPKMVVAAAAKYAKYNPEMNWSMRLAWDRYTELGIPLPKWFYAGVQMLGASCPAAYLQACRSGKQISAGDCG